MPFRTLLSLSSLRDKTNYTSPINVKQSSFFRSHKMNSTIFSRFLRALRRRQLKQKLWKMVWFSMSLYKFKSSQYSPCNQSTQRRRKVYRCWVSSSPIKRAKHETCKYDVNHHGWAHHQGENQIHCFQCRKDQMDSSHHRCHRIFTYLGKPPWPNRCNPDTSAVRKAPCTGNLLICWLSNCCRLLIQTLDIRRARRNAESPPPRDVFPANKSEDFALKNLFPNYNEACRLAIVLSQKDNASEIRHRQTRV